jgi:hypothetical protein
MYSKTHPTSLNVFFPYVQIPRLQANVYIKLRTSAVAMQCK